MELDLEYTREGISKEADLLGSTWYSLLISLAIGPEMIIATVLLAVAESTKDTRAAIPISAEDLPLIMPLTLSSSHWTPPSLSTNLAKPPISMDKMKISNMPAKPS